MSDNLVVSDFVNENLSSDSSDSKSEKLEAKFLWWRIDDGASKVKFTPDVEDILHSKKHSKNKRIYFYKSENKMTVIEPLKVTWILMR